MKSISAIWISLVFLVPNITLASNGSGWKVAIIDTGIMSDQGSNLNKTTEQLCWSINDDRSEFDEFVKASTCIDGAQNDLNSSSAAVVPRIVSRSPLDIEPLARSNYYFGARHGSVVLDEARYSSGATGATFVAVNNSYYDSSNEATIGANTITCGFHGPDQSVPDNRWPSDHAGCYSPSDAEKQASVISKINAAGNVASINYSAEKLENCANNTANFLNFKNSNIAVVAAVGNRGSGSTVLYPACNQHVISVGALNPDLTLASTTSLGGYKVDFFADGIGAISGSPVPASSFAAPVVAGAFAVLQSARTEILSVDQMKYALEVSSPSCIPTPFGCRPVVTAQSIQVAAHCLNFGTCLLGEPEPEFPSLDYNDGSFYGSIYDDDSSNYTFDIDFDDFAINGAPASSPAAKPTDIAAALNTVTVPNDRDVVLSFDAEMANNSSNGFDVYINNTKRKSTGTFLNEQSFEYTLERQYFSSGNNTIRIEPIHSTRLWGLSNIAAKFTPVVELTLGQTDTNQYGSEEDPERPSGLRASFELDNTDYNVLFEVTGWDIDFPDEVTVYINGIDYGYLSLGTFNQYSAVDVFAFAKEDLISGTNMIELVQRDGVNRWGVTSLKVTQATPSTVTLTLGTKDTTMYGRNYGTNESFYQLDARFTPLSDHDHKLSWRAFDIDQSGDVEVYLNDTLIKNVDTTVNDSLGSTESVTLAWRLFQAGQNTLSFKVSGNAFDETWGVTDLLVKTSTVIDLDSPSNLNKDYGYYELYSGGEPAGWTRTHSTEDYQTRLHATFNSTATTDKFITVTGWDIDSASELEIYLNGNFLQYVTSAPSSSIYSDPDHITIPMASLINGTNTLTFKAEDSFSGFQNEKWGLRLGGPSVVMAPIIMLILDD